MAGNEKFVATGSALTDPGFFKIAGIPKIKNTLPDSTVKIAKGQEYDAEYSIAEGETKAPTRFTSGSLVLAMENAGQFVDDEEMRAQLKEGGIGTDATRAETIKKLVAIQYLDLNKNTQGITPAPFGRCVYEIVKSTVPELLNPKLTANWEKGLSLVADGKISKDNYLSKLNAFVESTVQKIKNAPETDERLTARIAPYKAKIPQRAASGAKKKFTVNAETYLNVPYDDRDQVKALGAWFDGERKSWYVPKGKDTAPFQKWITDQVPAKANGRKTYLKVPFEDKDTVKAAGARWDKDKKKWYITWAMMRAQSRSRAWR